MIELWFGTLGQEAIDNVKSEVSTQVRDKIVGILESNIKSLEATIEVEEKLETLVDMEDKIKEDVKDKVRSCVYLDCRWVQNELFIVKHDRWAKKFKSKLKLQ